METSKQFGTQAVFESLKSAIDKMSVRNLKDYKVPTIEQFKLMSESERNRVLDGLTAIMDLARAESAEAGRLMDEIRDYENLLTPKRYLTPSGFSNPRHISQGLATLVGPAIEKIYQETNRSLLGVIDSLLTCGMPFFFIKKELVEALIDTELPDEMTLKDVKWPFPGLTVMLPNGLIKAPKIGGIAEAELNCVFITKHESGPYYSQLLKKNTGIEGNFMRVSAITTIKEENGDPENPSFSYAVASSAMDASVAGFMKSDSMSVNLGKHGLTEEETNRVVNEWTNFIFTLGLKILLLIQSRPEVFVKEPELARPAKSKKGRTKEALWHPNFIGRNWSRSVPGLGGEGVSPRMHWRRGHWRNQAVGPRTENKRLLIWIEPVLVNADPVDEE